MKTTDFSDMGRRLDNWQLGHHHEPLFNIVLFKAGVVDTNPYFF